MSKSKSKKGEVPETSVLNTVKDAGVIKPSKSAKAKSKDLGKAVVEKQEKRSKKEKKVKEPTPEPESEEESSESSDNDSDSASGSDEEVVVKNGAAKEKDTKAKDDSDSSGSDDDSASDSEDEPEKPAKQASKAAVPVIKNGTKEKAAVSDDSDSSDSSDSSESDADSDEDKPAGAKISSKAAKSTSDSDSSDSSESDDDASSDESGKEQVEPARAAAKRKAEEPPTSIIKKAKTEATDDASQGTNLFVGSLSWNVDEAWLTEEFKEFGELSGVRVITDRDTGRSKGFAYVEFTNAEDAAKAHAAKQGAELDGRRINVDYASSRKTEFSKNPVVRAKAYGDQPSDPSDTLWVGNLSFSIDQDGIAQAFQEHGTITGIRLPTDRETGAPKGFGYVSFSSVDEAKAAFDAMQGYNLEGRSMRLDYSQPRQSFGDSPSRGGRGGGRGGFGDRGRGGFGGRGGGRGGFGDRGGRGGRGGSRGGRGGSTNRGGFSDFSGRKTTF